MNKEQKIKFVNELVGNVKKDLLQKITEVPEEWDGHELRQYIADRFSLVSYTWKEQPARRRRAYKNEILVRNLL